MKSIQELTQNIVDFRDERDWKQFHNPKDSAISLVLEATEILEHFQWKNGEEITKHIDAHRDEIADELADVFNWILLMSHDLGIDIVEAQARKIASSHAKYPVEKAKGNYTKYTEL